jgi:AcrR family transcriptional regulator
MSALFDGATTKPGAAALNSLAGERVVHAQVAQSVNLDTELVRATIRPQIQHHRHNHMPTTSKRSNKEARKSTEPVLSIREAQRELLLQRIHDAAWQLFFKQGYSSTTFDQIAAEAGARRSTLYKYFRDKEDILRMMAERYGDRLLEVAGTLPGPVPSRAEIDAWIQRIATFIRRERTPTALISSLSNESPDSVMDLGLRIVQQLAANVRAYQCALEPGPRQGRALAWAMIISREVCLVSLRQTRGRSDELTRNLFSVTGDIAEAFIREFS